MNKGIRLFVFIDASNLWQAQKIKSQFIDYQKLKSYLQNKYEARTIDVYFYTAYPADGTRDYSLDGKHKFYFYLSRGLGFIVRKKPLKQIQTETAEGIAIVEKGNMDVEMTIDAVHMYQNYDVAVLFSGDSDFLSLVTFLKKKGKQVYIYSSQNNISSELRTGGDGYIDLLKIEEDIWGRDLAHRVEKQSK